MTSEEIIIKPRLRPRGLLDLTLALLCPLPALSLMFLVMFVLPAMLFDSAMIGASLMLLGGLGLFAAGVYRLKITPEGIRFTRLWGGPKFLRWEDITSIQPASRWRVIARGWLWPGIPPKEATHSWTSLGQYEITWVGGYCFFPPADAEAFREQLAKHWPTQA